METLAIILHDDIYLLLRPEFMARGTSSVRDYQMEAKIKTQKNPMPNSRAIKVYLRNYMGTIKNLQIVLNTPKNLYLNQATQKNTCQNFPTPKNIQSSLSLEIRRTPQHVTLLLHSPFLQAVCQ